MKQNGLQKIVAVGMSLFLLFGLNENMIVNGSESGFAGADFGGDITIYDSDGHEITEYTASLSDETVTFDCDVTIWLNYMAVSLPIRLYSDNSEVADVKEPYLLGVARMGRSDGAMVEVKTTGKIEVTCHSAGTTTIHVVSDFTNIHENGSKYESTITLNVIDDKKTTAETQTEEITTASPKATLLGDTDGSGGVGIRDVIALTRYLHKFPVPETFDSLNADMNCDGVLNVIDLALLRRYLFSI